MFDENNNIFENNTNNEVNDNNNIQAPENTTYSMNREQLQNTWQPQTGNYYTNNNYDAYQVPNNNRVKKAKKVKVKKEKSNISFGKALTMSISCMLVGILASSGILFYVFTEKIENNYALKTEVAAASIGTTLDNMSMATSSKVNTEGLSTSQIVEAVMPSVVAITSTSIIQSNSNPFMYGGTYQVTGAGSGIIIGTNDTELLIVTNNHVVDGTTSLTVDFCNEVSIDTAYIKGTSSSNDLAIVAIKLTDLDSETLGAIKVATVGESDDLSVGDGVIAIGNALGYGQSVTTGVVSALNREITINSNAMTVIQTDASINGGNSGGALINMSGELVGINVAKASSNSSSSSSVEGMGYAIPISQVKEIITDLMNREVRTEVSEDERGYMGLTSCVDVDESTSAAYNIPVGVYIKGIAQGSPVDLAGISVNDVITAIDGEKVSAYEEIQNTMKYYSVGEEVTLTVQVRNGKEYKEKEFTLELVSYEDLEKLIDNVESK